MRFIAFQFPSFIIQNNILASDSYIIITLSSASILTWNPMHICTRRILSHDFWFFFRCCCSYSLRFIACDELITIWYTQMHKIFANSVTRPIQTIWMLNAWQFKRMSHLFFHYSRMCKSSNNKKKNSMQTCKQCSVRRTINCCTLNRQFVLLLLLLLYRHWIFSSFYV